jgi:hypothetical protein
MVTVFIQQYFSHMYIAVVSFICGGNRSTRRNPPTWHEIFYDRTCKKMWYLNISDCLIEVTTWAGFPDYKSHWTKMKNKTFIICFLLFTFHCCPYIVIRVSRATCNSCWSISYNWMELLRKKTINVLNSHLYLNITFSYKSCHRKFHVNWTSFKRSPVL